MKSTLVALLISISLAASAAAPEDAYVAARDAYTKTLEPLDKPNPNPAAASDDTFLKAQDAARADLETQLRAIIGPVSVKGFTGDGKINIESLIEGYEDYGKLDALAFASADGKTDLLVTTTTLAERWLKAHEKWWNENNVPQQLDAALTTGAFYTQAIANGAAFDPYVTLPITAKTTPAAAVLMGQSQDIGPVTPDRIVVATVQGGRLYIVNAPLRAKVTLTSACLRLWKDAEKKAAKIADSDRAERMRAGGDRAFHVCFTERAKQESFFQPATRQAQDILDTLTSR
jgi:hypothetical protein